jgi:acetate---CoA ligase (ADP-forming)
MPSRQLSALFAPRSVAVVGASNDTAKMGGLYFAHLLDGFDGRIYPVNRNGGVVLGRPAFSSLEELPEVPDVVFVAVPAAAAVSVTRSAADLGVPAVVLHTAGFAELGADGAEAESELTEYARARGTRIVGPNSMGIYGGATGVNLLGLPARPGRIAFISASGTLIESLAPQVTAAGLGFRNVVGFENQADIEIHEYLDYCADDSGVGIVAIYMEGIKNGNGRAFVDALGRAAATKPVVVLRGARTSAGQRSAVSHTAAMVSPSSIYEGLLRQANVVELDDESELMPFIEALSIAPPVKSGRIAVLGNGGGLATLTADAVERAGLEVPAFSTDVQASLRHALNPLAAVGNPVDAVLDNDGDGTIWAELADIVLRDEVGAILKFGLYDDEMETRPFDSIATEATALGRVKDRSGVPVFVYIPHGAADDRTREVFAAQGIPVLRTPRIASRVMAASAQYGQRGSVVPPHGDVVLERGVEGACGTALGEADSLDIVERLGLPTPARQFVAVRDLKSDSDIVRALDAAEVVVKIVVEGVHHKSDLGGVRTKVPRSDALEQARDMARSFAEAGYEVDGVLVMEHVTADGPELLVNLARDPAVGPVLTIGAGGVLTELLRDVITFAAPVTATEAQALLSSLQVRTLLEGYRGSRAVDLTELAAAIATFSSRFADDPNLLEVEVNPLMTSAAGAWAVDAIVRTKEQSPC